MERMVNAQRLEGWTCLVEFMESLLYRVDFM